MRLDLEEHSIIHCALGLYMSSIVATLKENKLTQEEREMLERIQIEVQDILQRFRRRYRGM
jgi:hypothetical protein